MFVLVAGKTIKDSLNKFLMFMAPIYIIIIWNMYNMKLNRGKICDYMPILTNYVVYNINLNKIIYSNNKPKSFAIVIPSFKNEAWAEKNILSAYNH